MKAVNYSYDMELKRTILERDFRDLGYEKLAALTVQIEGYDNLTLLAETLHKIAIEMGRFDIANAMYFEGWIHV